MVSATSSQAPLTLRRVFQHGIHVERSVAHLLGGLGNVAGDQLKAASDLGVPVVGVGLLYQQGYFRQVIDSDGAQQALYPLTTRDSCQSRHCATRTASGCDWRSPCPVTRSGCAPGRFKSAESSFTCWTAMTLRTFRLTEGSLASSMGAGRNCASNRNGARIGGWRLLAALGIHPEVCHLNEGHAAFAVLERARGFMAEAAQPFEVALAVTRAGNLFTTHTAVAAGFDRFAPALIEQYLGRYAREKLGISVHDLLALGRQHPEDSAESFNMALSGHSGKRGG